MWQRDDVCRSRATTIVFPMRQASGARPCRGRFDVLRPEKVREQFFKIRLADHHFVTPFNRFMASPCSAKAAHHCSPVVRILENRTGYAVRPPRHRASTSTSGETGRMLSSRSVRPSTTRGISLRSMPMSRSRRSSMPRRVSIIFRHCQRWNTVRSHRRNAPGLRLR